MFEMPSHNKSIDGLNTGLKNSSINREKRPTKKIIHKYHEYKYDLLLG